MQSPNRRDFLKTLFGAAVGISLPRSGDSSVTATPLTQELTLITGAGGNIVVVASDAPLPLDGIRQQLTRLQSPYGILGTEQEVRQFIGDAPLLTDDYAPVDQLLTPYGHS